MPSYFRGIDAEVCWAHTPLLLKSAQQGLDMSLAELCGKSADAGMARAETNLQVRLHHCASARMCAKVTRRRTTRNCCSLPGDPTGMYRPERDAVAGQAGICTVAGAHHTRRCAQCRRAGRVVERHSRAPQRLCSRTVVCRQPQSHLSLTRGREPGARAAFAPARPIFV